MTEHLEDFVNIACDIKSKWKGENVATLDMIMFAMSNSVRLAAVGTRLNLSPQYINNTLISVFESTSNINEVFKYINSTDGRQQQPTTPTNITDSVCRPTIQAEEMIPLFFIPALIIMLILSLVTVRVWKKSFCSGHPGLAIPVNLLDSYENRYTYAIAFGATSSRIVLIILTDNYANVFGKEGGKEIDMAPSYVKAIFKILASIIIGVSYYPFFACISTHRRMLGAVLGSFYSILWFLAYVIQIVECGLHPDVENTVVENILLQLPPIICHGFLVLCFLWVFMRTMISKRRGWVITKDEWKENYKYYYVKTLVKRIPESEQSVIVVNGFKRKVASNVYKWRPGFKYSTRMICIYITACICLYLVIINYIILGRALAKFSKEIVDSFQDDSVKPRKNDEFLEKLKDGVDVAMVCWMVAIAVALIKDVVMMGNMLTWYRGHAVRLQRGDRSFLPVTINTTNATNIMVASFKFAGYQVSYIIWGFIITHIVVFLVNCVLAYGFIWPLVWGGLSDSIGFSIVIALWPTLFISILTILMQKMLAKYVFLRDFGATLALNNRRLFHIASYFFFFLNIFVGLISCLIRILYAMLFGVLFLARLQKSAMPRDWELFDPGYKAYVGYLCLEHSHTNPILFTFSRLILDDVESYADVNNAKRIVSRKARNRWCLAVTLINNPELTSLRNQEKPKSVFLGLKNIAMSTVSFVSEKSQDTEVEEITSM